MRFIDAFWHVMRRLTGKKLEPFSADVFARAVMKQNPEVWERMAEM